MGMLQFPSFKGIHKGSHGSIVIIGGSENYTGAPFFSGIAALRTGADLVTIFTHPKELIPIKSYCPDLMVSDYNNKDHLVKVVEKCHAVVIGPGLGSDTNLSNIIDAIKSIDVPVILDADGLQFCHSKLFKNVLLTPNINEYKKINPNNLSPNELATSLQATILLKGQHDSIYTSTSQSTIKDDSGPRRCGGQGDLLTGMLATLAAWHPTKLPTVAEYGSKLLRKSSLLCSNASPSRSMITSDIPNYIGQAFDQLFNKN